jgi:3-deoxy-D-manno-octulosonic-acid transferase
VIEIKNKIKGIPLLEEFKSNSKIFIAGSSWAEDENTFLPSTQILRDKNFKIIIAPHEVSEKRIIELTNNLSKYFSNDEVTRYTSGSISKNSKVLIIDTVGILSSAYQYGTIAWIGGGFGKGIHNILEAAVFGMPVIFGRRYEKFREAVDLIRSGGAFTVSNSKEAEYILAELLTDSQKLIRSSEASNSYVLSKGGATNKIFSELQKLNSKERAFVLNQSEIKIL